MYILYFLKVSYMLRYFGYIIVIIKIICYNIRLDNKNDNKSINDVGIASYW